MSTFNRLLLWLICAVGAALLPFAFVCLEQTLHKRIIDYIDLTSGGEAYFIAAALTGESLSKAFNVRKADKFANWIIVACVIIVIMCAVDWGLLASDRAAERRLRASFPQITDVEQAWDPVIVFRHSMWLLIASIGCGVGAILVEEAE